MKRTRVFCKSTIFSDRWTPRGPGGWTVWISTQRFGEKCEIHEYWEEKKMPEWARLWDFWYFLLLVKRKCLEKGCSISVLLYLSPSFPTNIDSLFSLRLPPSYLWWRGTLEAERWGCPLWAGLRCRVGRGWGGQQGAGRGGEVNQLRVLWGFICCVFMTLYKSHRERWKRPWTGFQEARVPVLAWLLTSCVALGKSRFWVSVSLSVKWNRLTLMKSKLLFISKMLWSGISP